MTSVRQSVVEESLDFFGRRVIFSDGSRRLQFFQMFEELYEREAPLNTFTYGRIFNLSEVTEFLVILTQGAWSKNHDPLSGVRQAGNSLLPDTKPFCMWKADDWRKFREHLNGIQANMLRCDANALIANSSTNQEYENGAIDVHRSQEKWFTTKLLKVLDLFTLHEKLAPFREFLEESSLVSGNKALIPLSPPEEMMMDFIETAESLEENRIRNAFLTFMRNDKSNTFHSPSTIRGLLDDPTQPYSFTLFVNRVNKLLRAWVKHVFEDAIDSSLAITNTDRKEIAIRKLQRSRAQLTDRVEDPLPEIIAAATKANSKRRRAKSNRTPSEESVENNDVSDEESEETDTAHSGSAKRRKTSPIVRGKLLEKKPSAKRLNFTPEKESDSEVIEDPKEDELLPDMQFMPKPEPVVRKLKSQQKKYEGKRMWTDIEKAAIMDGIIALGVGKWAQIKKTSGAVLKDRTSGQIKDCYRTMKKRGELDDIEEAWPEKQNDPTSAEKQNDPTSAEQEETENAEEAAATAHDQESGEVEGNSELVQGEVGEK